MGELVAVLIGALFLVFAFVVLFWEQIAVMLIVREIRRQAAMLPEDRREAYLREGLSALDRACEQRATLSPTPKGGG